MQCVFGCCRGCSRLAPKRHEVMNSVTGIIVRSIRHWATIRDNRCVFDANAIQNCASDAIVAQSRGLGAEDIRHLRQRCRHTSEKHLRTKAPGLTCTVDDLRIILTELGVLVSSFVLGVMQQQIVEQATPEVRPPR
eukprot:8467750-Pyramimonas_sp.AAC.1